MTSGDFFKILADKELMGRCKCVEDVYREAKRLGYTDSEKDFMDSVSEMMKDVDPNWNPNKNGFGGQAFNR